MLRLTEIRLPLGHDAAALDRAVRETLGLPTGISFAPHIARRGIDARRRGAIVLVYTLDVAGLSPAHETELLARFAGNPRIGAAPDLSYRFHPPIPARPSATRPLVVGAGPCGLFAALMLARWGLRPLVVERGRDVRTRTADTWRLWRQGVLDPESNVQFGEGGAGTFSDGKLWSGVSDPQHLGRKVLEELVAAGAPEEILFVSKPHVGTFRLVTVVTRIRETIERLGGEYSFSSRVIGLRTGPGRALTGLTLESGRTLPVTHAVLAPGHSARDTFAWLQQAGVALEKKPFSIGVRIEHPQSLIDAARLGPNAGHPILGAADYKLVHHGSDPDGTPRTVYSFCMCPGGQVVAATSESGRVATNGMSQYSRAERNANAGIVVEIRPEDLPAGPLSGIEFQRDIESAAFVAGGSDYRAPAQTVADFLARRPSTELGSVLPSYRPGTTPTDLALCLPDFVCEAIRAALPAFARKIPGFDHPDAVMTGVETRTSSPIRIPRDARFRSPDIPGLYPAGEGAGYAGGILSAAIDGIRVAEALATDLCEERTDRAA